MSEQTSQGQQYGTTGQGGPSQPQSGQFQPMQEQQHPRDEVPQYNPPQERDENTPDKGGTLTRDEVNQIVAEALSRRDEEHAQETAKLRAQVPALVVPAHGGGPGNDNHQTSWNLAEQEAARRGETLEHWE